MEKYNSRVLSYDKCPTEVNVLESTKNGVVAAHLERDVDFKLSKLASTATVEAAAAPISKIFIDDLTEQPKIWEIPWFIVIMCLLQISVFAIANECIYRRFMFVPGHGTECWRYLTYTLLHSDRIHLLLNLCLQCLIGFCLETEQSHWKVASIYVVGGVSGSLATALFQPQLSLLGASACVYAMLMSHIPHLAKNFSRLPHRYLRIAALLILCLSDVSFTTFHFLVNRNANPRICLVAHIAGGLSGLCCGFLLYNGHGRTPSCCTRTCTRRCSNGK